MNKETQEELEQYIREEAIGLKARIQEVEKMFDSEIRAQTVEYLQDEEWK